MADGTTTEAKDLNNGMAAAMDMEELMTKGAANVAMEMGIRMVATTRPSTPISIVPGLHLFSSTSSSRSSSRTNNRNTTL